MTFKDPLVKWRREESRSERGEERRHDTIWGGRVFQTEWVAIAKA